MRRALLPLALVAAAALVTPAEAKTGLFPQPAHYSAALRWEIDTTSARTLPVLIFASTTEIQANSSCTSAITSPTTEGAAPFYKPGSPVLRP